MTHFRPGFHVLSNNPDRLNTRRVVRGRGTDQEYSTTRRTATELAQQETNMFHLGTRLPALDDERRLSAYSAFDLKPGFPPHQPSASQSVLFFSIHFPVSLIAIDAVTNNKITPIENSTPVALLVYF
jgi:hypothetical protein